MDSSRNMFLVYFRYSLKQSHQPERSVRLIETRLIKFPKDFSRLYAYCIDGIGVHGRMDLRDI